jgi:hypothetical protein
MIAMKASRLFATMVLLLFVAVTFRAAAQDIARPEAQQQDKPVFVRVTLVTPAPTQPWRVRVNAFATRSKTMTLFAGSSVGTDANGAGTIEGKTSPWIDLATVMAEHRKSPNWTEGLVSVAFRMEPGDRFDGKTVKATFDFATAPNEQSIVRSVTEYDPGNLIGFRVPPDITANKAKLLSIREDTQRRLDEVRSFNLPDGPLPVKIWAMTGFRANTSQFYTDPAIAEMDMTILDELGMNGMWEQGGGQPEHVREMARSRGINRSTVYWRSIASPPRDGEVGGTRLDWKALEEWATKNYSGAALSTQARNPTGGPTVVVDLMDEPAGSTFAGPEYQQGFRDYLRQNGITAEFLGIDSLDDVEATTLGWRSYFTTRDALDLSDEMVRRRFYWSSRFWNHVNARMYSMATRLTEQYAPGVGTRVNFGPPFWYDYGHLPRGIDAYEFGKLRSVNLGFNEDWIGDGDPRWPLEINPYIVDFSRAALRTQRPDLGMYITRDANRATVKLRTFGALARETRMFDFYYYGPAYTYFDHWSDNSSMVHGVGELLRDMGKVDDVLAEGKAPTAEVALLYSRSWPAWKTDDTEQVEVMMVYTALLHAGVPVDLVWDEEIADGRFESRQYKVLYVVNESVLGKAASEIDRWVKNGGQLWLAGAAGMRDEYNTSTDAWNAMLGITSRSWTPTGDLTNHGKPIEPADWKRPYFGRKVETDGNDGATTLADLKGPDGLTPWQRGYGKGKVQFVPWAPGVEYANAAKRVDASQHKAILYPEGAQRDVITQFALDAGVAQPATTAISQVLAWPLWRQHDGVVMIANFTGEPVADVKVTFESPIVVESIESIRHGKMAFEQVDQRTVTLTLPRVEVTDILIVKSKAAE